MPQVSLKTKDRLLSALFGALAVIIIVLIISLFQSIRNPKQNQPEANIDTAQTFAEVPSDIAAEYSLSSGEITRYDPDDVIIIFPPGALNQSSAIEVSPRDPDLFSAVGATGWKRTIVVNVSFRDAEGQVIENVKFNRPIDVCFVLNNERWTRYAQDPVGIQVEYFRKDGNEYYWTALRQKTDVDRKLLCGQIDFLTMFALSEKVQE